MIFCCCCSDGTNQKIGRNGLKRGLWVLISGCTFLQQNLGENSDMSHLFVERSLEKGVNVELVSHSGFEFKVSCFNKGNVASKYSARDNG